MGPGHGRTLVKADGKSYKFLSSRTHKAHMLKRNPRKITWTVLYRRKHKKGLEEDVTKKRNQKPGGSRQSAPPRIRRKPPSRSLLSRTRLRRRLRRRQRMCRRPAPAGLGARDKYFAFKFL